MKKLLLLMISLSWLTFAYAQEMITGGNLESDASWTVFWRSDAADMGTTAFNYTSDIPSNGAGGCLSIESFGQTGAHVYQMVTLIPGHSYSFTGAFKNANSSDDTLQFTWAELILSRSEPPSGSDFTAGTGDFIYAMNVWKAAPFDTFKYGGFDGTFQDNFEFLWKGAGASGDSSLTGSSEFILPDTTTVTEWYVVIKAGCWSAAPGDETVAFNLLYDEISLWDLAEPLPSGINDLSYSNELFEIYPNPSQGIVMIKPHEGNNLAYKIYNNLGMLVVSGDLNSTSKLDLSNLSKGTYLINVTSGTKTKTSKLVIQ